MLDKIGKLLTEGLVKTLGLIAEAVKSVFGYLSGVRADKKEKQKKEIVENAEKELDKACDKGGLQDLIDAASKYGDAKNSVKAMAVAAALAIAAAGCHSVDVTTTRPYEGRYDDPKKAAAALQGAKLGRGESVWVLSNETLKYILKKSGN